VAAWRLRTGNRFAKGALLPGGPGCWAADFPWARAVVAELVDAQR